MLNVISDIKKPSNEVVQNYSVEQTVIKAHSHYYKFMHKEIFASVHTVFVFKENEFEDILDSCDNTSPYGLTGSNFSNDRQEIITAFNKLRHAAVVGKQPFGGSRGSGTNYKSEYSMNLTRWVSQKTIKEYFGVKTTYKYPFMENEQ